MSEEEEVEVEVEEKCDWKGGEEGSRWEVMMEEVEEFLSRKQRREKDCPQVSTNLEKYSKIRK